MKKNKMKEKNPWPTDKAMEQVYEKHLWGGIEHDFYSGEGSHHPKIVVPYVTAVSQFLSSFKSPITVCDLGCGDFNIGKQLISFTQKYIGVDIVPNLITRNKQKFFLPNLEFYCLDLAKDTIPKANCVLIRQVLQHLSNQEIIALIPKLYQYKYLILTEHLPTGQFVPNLDVISGQGIRLKKKSGVCLDISPFNLKFTKKEQILSYVTEDGKGKIVTTIYHL